jgi:hypothetical protein
MTCSGVEHFGEDIYKRNQSYHCRFERVTGKNSKINQYLEAQSLDAFGWWLCSRWLGPPNIGGKARWNFLKIWLICTDKIPKFLHQMFGLQQALGPNDNFGSDRPSALKKTKFV